MPTRRLEAIVPEGKVSPPSTEGETRQRAVFLPLCLTTAAIGVSLLLSSCSQPTQGPTVRIGEDGWAANPPTMTQERLTFELTLVNALDRPVSFVIVRMDYGEVTDLPLVNGVPDVDRGTHVIHGALEEEKFAPDVMGPLVVAYHLVHPDVDEVTPATAPVLEPGEERKVRVGNPGLGGGEPGSYVVISYEPGGLERGDYAFFTLATEDGEIPRMSPVDICIPDPFEPLRIGDPFPPWQGSLLDGATFDSGTLAGDPTLILVYPALQPDAVLEVFGSVVDDRQGEINAVMVNTVADEGLADLLAAAGVTTPVVVEDSCELQAIFRIGWEQPPYWIVIDGNGVITGLAYGPRSIDEVHALIDESVPPDAESERHVG